MSGEKRGVEELAGAAGNVILRIEVLLYLSVSFTLSFIFCECSPHTSIIRSKGQIVS